MIIFDAHEIFGQQPHFSTDFDQEIHHLAVHFTSKGSLNPKGWFGMSKDEQKVLAARYLWQKSKGIDEMYLFTEMPELNLKKILIKVLVGQGDDVKEEVYQLLITSVINYVNDPISELIDEEMDTCNERNRTAIGWED